MKQDRKFPYVKITKKQEARLKDGHPWVYSNEIIEQSDEIENGSLTDVFGLKGNYLGTGIWSQLSLIRIRILDRNANETFTDAFFERRVKYAVDYRRTVMPGSDFLACRLVHGEADGLPGLTIDRYNDILVSEVLSYGMDQRKDVIYRALVNELEKDGYSISGIYERNEGELRKKEGLSQYKGWYNFGRPFPNSPVTEILENDIYYKVDVENGQKTGFFLDQKYNRKSIWQIAKGRNVLDCCTHTGSFALNAKKAGATHVTAVDISELALDFAKENAERNGLLDGMDFVQADIMELLPNLLLQNKKYDFIILDPPAFTKSRKTFNNAKNGYLKINTMAMRLLPRGGYLSTASCSHFMPTEEFKSMLHEAGKQAGVTVRIIEERHAAPDHPVIAGIDETDYLKFFLIQVI